MAQVGESYSRQDELQGFDSGCDWVVIGILKTNTVTYRQDDECSRGLKIYQSKHPNPTA